MVTACHPHTIPAPLPSEQSSEARLTSLLRENHMWVGARILLLSPRISDVS